MISKNIVFTNPGKAEILEENVPALKSNEVLVKLAVSSISSGTERANLTGNPNVSIGKGEVSFPRRCGYSSSGTVLEVGSDVKSLKAGDRVAMTWTTHSQYINMGKSNVYKISDNITFEDAALFNIATFPLAAIRKCHLEIGESAIIMGMGILGLLSIPLLKSAGAAPIIAVDPIAEKREKALSAGADYALDPYDTEFAQKAKDLTGGGANIGIEVTGVGAGLDGILDCMAPFGRVALLGCTRSSDFTIDYYCKVHGPGISLIGAHTLARPKIESHAGYWTQSDDINAIIKLTEMGRIKLSDMIDEVYSPLEAPEVYTRLAGDKSFPIVQFDWRRI